MLLLDKVSVTLGRGSQLERRILQNLSLEAKSGEFLVIIGNNGAGKSTLFNAISGQIALESGRVVVGGSDIVSLSGKQRASLTAKVVQDPRVGTISNMTIEENLSFALLRGRKRSLMPYKNVDRRSFFREKLALLDIGMESRLNEIAGNLSGGQCQALSLVMAILADSKILLLDEITAALDPKMADRIMELTAKVVAEEKRTTIMITHNMSHALKYGDRTLILADGRIMKQYDFVQKRSMSPLDLAMALEKEN